MNLNYQFTGLPRKQLRAAHTLCARNEQTSLAHVFLGNR